MKTENGIYFPKEKWIMFFQRLETGPKLHLMSAQEIAEDIAAKTKITPRIARKRRGFGLRKQFTRVVGNFYVRVNTICRENAGSGEVSDNDAYNWVVLRDMRVMGAENEEMLYSFEIRKSENMFEILYEYAESFSDIMDNIPCCPQCGEQLSLIFMRQGRMHAMMFVCKNRTVKHREKRPEIYLTNINVSGKTKKFLDSKFHRAYQREDREREKGITREPKRVTRSLKKIPKPPEEQK